MSFPVPYMLAGTKQIWFRILAMTICKNIVVLCHNVSYVLGSVNSLELKDPASKNSGIVESIIITILSLTLIWIFLSNT